MDKDKRTKLVLVAIAVGAIVTVLVLLVCLDEGMSQAVANFDFKAGVKSVLNSIRPSQQE